jgi:hypothetical protein
VAFSCHLDKYLDNIVLLNPSLNAGSYNDDLSYLPLIKGHGPVLDFVICNRNACKWEILLFHFRTTGVQNWWHQRLHQYFKGFLLLENMST